MNLVQNLNVAPGKFKSRHERKKSDEEVITITSVCHFTHLLVVT